MYPQMKPGRVWSRLMSWDAEAGILIMLLRLGFMGDTFTSKVIQTSVCLESKTSRLTMRHTPVRYVSKIAFSLL